MYIYKAEGMVDYINNHIKKKDHMFNHMDKVATYMDKVVVADGQKGKSRL